MKWSDYSRRRDEGGQPSRRLSVRRGQLRRECADDELDRARREPDELLEPLAEDAPPTDKPSSPPGRSA